MVIRHLAIFMIFECEDVFVSGMIKKYKVKYYKIQRKEVHFPLLKYQLNGFKFFNPKV